MYVSPLPLFGILMTILLYQLWPNMSIGLDIHPCNNNKHTHTNSVNGFPLECESNWNKDLSTKLKHNSPIYCSVECVRNKALHLIYASENEKKKRTQMNVSNRYDQKMNFSTRSLRLHFVILVHFDFELETFVEFIFQMLWRPETLAFAIDKYGELSA